MVIKQHTELVLATFVFETDRPHHHPPSLPSRGGAMVGTPCGNNDGDAKNKKYMI